MARKRKGQLIWRSTKGWCARVPITVEGARFRKVFELGTRDKLVARRRLARLLADTEDTTLRADEIAEAATRAESSLRRRSASTSCARRVA